MAIYKMPHAGTKLYRSKVKFRPRKLFTLTYGEVFPTVAKFVVPGDVWKISANMFVRYRPTLAPVLTEANIFTRFFFVPLRQVVENLEEIITGSKNGSLIGSALPECPNFVKEFLTRTGSPGGLAHCCVHRNSFWAALGVRPNIWVKNGNNGTLDTYNQYNYDAEIDNKNLPAAYWYKAYCKIIWEYFRDENYQSFDGDFDKFYDFMMSHKNNTEVTNNAWYPSNDYARMQCDSSTPSAPGVNVDSYMALQWKLWFCDIRKDYFSSSLPWILKGVQPTINSVMHTDFYSQMVFPDSPTTGPNAKIYNLAVGNFNGTLKTGFHSAADSSSSQSVSFAPHQVTPSPVYISNDSDSKQIWQDMNTIHDGGFTAQDIRDMFAETRVFERLARCGSRYVEYLEANFGIAPRDDTLQRPLYLGGFSQPIVTTEVVQTGGSSDGTVGTLRGHGISSGGNRIKPFVATEFGMIFGLTYVTPKTQYLYQMKKELSYKSRFDFLNPSFQLLSEQQVNSMEYYTPVPKVPAGTSPNTDVTSFDPIPNFTLGYQGMYNELRYDNDIICRDLVDTDAFWTQAINPGLDPAGYERLTTPPLNGQNICLGTYLPSLLRPFEGALNGSFKPMIVDFGLHADVFRPLVRDPIPGLVDHA